MATFKDWYALNSAKLAATRKLRYDTDPEYRRKVKEMAVAGRIQRRLNNPPPDLPGLSVAEACTAIGISEWTLSSWRDRKYYPEPSRTHGNRIWFTQAQVELLGLIQQFFTEYPRRLAGLHREELQGVVDVIHHNWSA